MMLDNRWLAFLKQHYTAPLELSFKQFKLGAMVFFFGFVLVYIASSLMQPTLQQEIVLLLGLIIGGLGFIIAMMAQVRMLISRLLRFFLND